VTDTSSLGMYHGKRAHRQGRTKTIMTYLVKAAPEAALTLCTIIPLFVDDTKGDVLIRRSGDEADEASVLSPSRCKRLTPLATVLALDTEGRCFGCVDKIGVEDVELVALNDFGREVFVVVMSLVVLVPLVTHLNSVEVAWFSWTVCLCPFRSASRDVLLGIEGFLVIVEAPRGFSVIQCACDPRHVVPLRFRRQGEISSGCLSTMTCWDVAELEDLAPVLDL
jgi:hypothetical protein